MFPRENFTGDEKFSYDDLQQTENLIRGRALERIQQRKRGTSGLGVSTHSNPPSGLDEVINGSPQGHRKALALSSNDEDDAKSTRTFSVEQMQQEMLAGKSLLGDKEIININRQESDDDLEEVDDMQAANDLREELFGAIPEPYYQSTDFQRVHITETTEPPEQDTIDACAMLSKCMKLRNKWMDAHPFPPQDMVEQFGDEVITSPYRNYKKHPQETTTKTDPAHFRRRAVPPYEIFKQELPETIPDMKFKMVNGIMHVNYTTQKCDFAVPGVEPVPTPSAENGKEQPPQLLSKAISVESTLGLSISADENDKQESSRPLSFRIPSIFLREDECLDVDWSKTLFPVFSFLDFWTDYEFLRRTVYSGPTMSFAYKRLELLAAKFNLHVLLNDRRELEAQKSVPHRDFYNVRKVDTHVHHSACMNQKHMLRFIKYKLKHHPNEAVIFRDGRFLTLGEVFKSLNLTAYDLSIDTLDMHANNTFKRFDRFNLKYNPAGQSRLREIFLKTDNIISGSFLAEITREVMSDLEASKYQLVEWRISIYGRKASEWSALSRWFYVNRLAHPNVRWLIQVPRLYEVYRKSGEISSFAQMLSNIFAPLFAVSIDPASNPPMHYFLQTVVAFDSVDDESKPEPQYLMSTSPTPEQWTGVYPPPYAYWMYYIYANICALNKLRASRGLNTFQFRPHCGEAGDADHMIANYLCANQINHGILLRKNAALQYLYYLSQIGIAMSPLSNNKLFLDYNKNPFPRYFCQGMNVSLSTDDPLMLHYTKDALLEEYSVAAQVWKLSATDQCEIARLSVLQSGWEKRFKLHFLGKDFSDIRETNVPEVRLIYRRETLQQEIENIEVHAKLKAANGHK